MRSDPSDIGQGQAANLAADRFAKQTRYAEPAYFTEETPAAGVEQGNGPTDIPTHYNLDAPYPSKYNLPTGQKHHMAIKQAIRDTTKDVPGVVRTDPITEEEIEYVASMERQGELADFDRYVQTLVDPRKPGNLEWLYKIYPDLIHRQINQVNTDFEFAMKNKLIDMYGINTLEDLHFKYMVDQGKINGPNMAVTVDPGNMYKMGSLAPWFWEMDRESGLKLPFASAKTGRAPFSRQLWSVSDNNQPLQAGRSLHQMASVMQGSATDRAGDPARDRNMHAARYQAQNGLIPAFQRMTLGEAVVPRPAPAVRPAY